MLPELDAERCDALPTKADRLACSTRSSASVCSSTCSTRRCGTLRLHDLFRAALQQRLALEAPARLAMLRERAAETERDPVRRVGFLLSAGRLDAAAELALIHLP